MNFINKMAQDLDGPTFAPKKNTQNLETGLDAIDLKPRQPIKKQDPAEQAAAMNVLKMQSDIQSLASKVLSSANNTLYGVLSGQTGIKFDLQKAMNELSINKFKADGRWGIKTQEALSAIYKLAGALINTNATFNLKVPGYSPEYFTNLRQLINGYKFKKTGLIDLPLVGEYNQGWRADLLSAHINALISFYGDVVSALQNKNIDLNKPIVKKDKSNELHGEDKELVNQYLQNYGERDLPLTLNFDGKQMKITIPVMALQSSKDFKDWFTTGKYKDQVEPFGSAEEFFTQIVKPQLG